MHELWADCFTVIDFESTGVTTDEDRPTELGIVRFERGQVVDRANYLVNPQRRIATKASEISGIRQVDVEHAPLFASVWEQVADLCHEAYPVAYNAPFDRRLLQNSIRESRKDDWAAQVVLATHFTQRHTLWLDPLVWIRQVDKFKKGKKLTDACARRNINIERAHRAVDDAEAAGELLLYLANKLPERYEAAVDQQTKMRVQQETDYQKYKARKDGRATIDGAVWLCDSCQATAWGHGKAIPNRWGRFHSTDMKLRGEPVAATCSAGCDGQMIWWDKGLAWLNAHCLDTTAAPS